MKEYHKIQTVFKRDEKTKHIIEGAYSLPELEYLKDNKWVFTEKVDGTNIRVMWDGANVVFGGKTDNAQIPVFLLYKLQELFEGTVNKQKLSNLFPLKEGQSLEAYEPLEVCLYGEGYGKKIQGGVGELYIPDGNDFVLFDVKIGDWWLERENVEGVAQGLGIKCVPAIGSGSLQDAIEMTRKGFKSQWGDFIAEGIVARPKVELKTRSGERVITKIKHRDFV
jgi:hypothetical protein